MVGGQVGADVYSDATLPLCDAAMGKFFDLSVPL
jgi:hypothetical protein